MNFWTAVVIIVAITAVVRLMKARYRAQAGIVADKQGNERAIERGDTESKRELEELRDRVKVLEKITVDGREAKAIADEIEKLRDK